MTVRKSLSFALGATLLLALPAAAATPLAMQVKPAPSNFAGAFLAADFAQSRNDWPAASRELAGILAKDPDNLELAKRAMIVAMGAGDLAGAAAQAKTLLKNSAGEGLPGLIIALDDLSRDQPKAALDTLASLPPTDMTNFIRPLLRGWAAAGLGQLDTVSLQPNGVHQYNDALMALYLHKPDIATGFARRLASVPGATAYDLERAADVLAATGQKDAALTIYAKLAGTGESGALLDRKMAAVRRGENLKAFIPALEIATAKQGAAGAVFDLARVMFQQHSDATAELFASMALALDPGLLPARLLVSSVLARGGNYDAAVRMFATLPPNAPDYDAIEQYVAELLQKGGHTDQALALTQRLYARTHDLDTLIRIGDLQRIDNHFGEALKTYTQAMAQLGPHLPASYWYLLYARGMCYEQLKQWPKAEADLQAALTLQPDEAYVLNYLAYGWAERGLHYDAALKLAQRASALKPDDGFIADSVGWIEFLQGRYAEAAAQLEKAVSLAPGDATLNEHLGDAYWRTGREDDARFQWQRALTGKADPAQKKTLAAKIASGLPAPAKTVR